MRNRIFLSWLAVAVATAPLLRAAAPIDAGAIEETIGARTIPVRVEADTVELRNLASRAFGAHGAFRLEAGGNAQYTLRFAVTGAAAVRVTVETGQPARAAFSQEASGSSLQNALLRAADAAVTHLTRLPGIFSGKVAFVSEVTGASEIHIADLFFVGWRRYTSDGSQAVLPRWSPDGQRILYTGYHRNGFPDIYVIDTATNRRDVFVSKKGTNTGARFSPDGQRVAMILSAEGNPELYLGNAQGRVTARLTRTLDRIEATPSWSRDGSRLVIASDAERAVGKPQLFLISASAGSTMQRLPTDISGYCAEPDWSHGNPDLIAFTAAEGRGYQVAVYSISQRKTRWVSTTAGDGIEPCWLPDGRHLLYTVRSSGSSRIYLLDTETKRATAMSPTSLGKCYQANYVAR